MRKTVATLLMVIITAGLLFAGCSAKSASSTDDSWNKIKEKGELVVGLDETFAPMGFKDESGNIVGFDIDLAKEAAKRMGINVKFQPIVWENKTLELNNKNIDVIWNGLTITEQRKKEILFTKPYMEDKQILVVAKGSAIKGKADLAGKKVGLQAGSSSEEALKKDEATFKSIKEVVPYAVNDQALNDLKFGRIDAVVVDEVAGRYYIAKRMDDYTILEDHFGLEEFGIGLRLNDASFLAELEKALDSMKKDGTAAKISKEWFGEDIIK